MRKLNYGNIQTPAPVYEAPAPGAYPCTILEVKDNPAEDHLNITADINDGPFKGHFTRWRQEHPDWRDPLTYRKYYTTRALPFFRRFCDAVSRSNGGYVFDGDTVNADEKTLVGKKIGLVLRAREYYGNDGNLRTRLEVYKEIPIDRVPYEPVPKTLTIADQEAREARRQGATPAPAPAQTYAQPAQAAPAQAFAQAPAPAPAYQQPVQTVAPAPAYSQQTAAPAYVQAQQPAQQAYAQNPALAQFVDVSGSMDEMPFA